MIRIIKRYESRKLYDTEESRYVALEDIAKWVRSGQDVRVVDNATSADVTAQVLTQIILDEGKKGTSFLPTDLLHELVRAGEKAVATGVEQVQGKVDRLVQASIDRLGPVRRARQEMGQLRDRLSKLEETLVDLETRSAEVEEPESAPARRRKAPAKTTAAKTTAAKTTAAKTTAAKTTAAKTTAAKTTAAKTTAARAKTAAKPKASAKPKTATKAKPVAKSKPVTKPGTTAKAKAPAAPKAAATAGAGEGSESVN